MHVGHVYAIPDPKGNRQIAERIDFEMADPDVLGQTFPHAAGLVREFC